VKIRYPFPPSLPALLVALSLFLFGAANAESQDSTARTSAENSTIFLLQMNTYYQQAGAAEKPQVLSQLQALAAQRQQLLSSLIQTNPGDVLRIAIPSHVSQNMPPTVRGYVEQSVTAQGVLQVLYEMQGTPDALPALFYITSCKPRRDAWHCTLPQRLQRTCSPGRSCAFMASRWAATWRWNPAPATPACRLLLQDGDVEFPNFGICSFPAGRPDISC
jgi:hypothetical protein